MGTLVAKKERDSDVTELELVAYGQKLMEWPGDVVRDVLNAYPDTHKWWPEWATLRALLAEASAERMAIAAAYRRWIEAPEFMARREGIAPPESPAKLIPAPANTAPPPERPPPAHQWTPEEIDARRQALKAEILKGKNP